MSDRVEVSPLLEQVAKRVCAALRDPRHVAVELIERELGATPPFMGEGSKECPWIVFSRTGGMHALYVRDRELVQLVSGQPDTVVGNL